MKWGRLSTRKGCITYRGVLQHAPIGYAAIFKLSIDVLFGLELFNHF